MHSTSLGWKAGGGLRWKLLFKQDLIKDLTNGCILSASSWYFRGGKGVNGGGGGEEWNGIVSKQEWRNQIEMSSAIYNAIDTQTHTQPSKLVWFLSPHSFFGISLAWLPFAVTGPYNSGHVFRLQVVGRQVYFPTSVSSRRHSRFRLRLDL